MIIDRSSRWRRWMGADSVSVGFVIVAAWRLSGLAVAVVVWQPVINVGRRGYTAVGLADRLDDLREMELVPTWLVPTVRSLVAVGVLTGLTAAVLPAKLRRIQALAPAATLALCLLARRATGSSPWTTATPWLAATAVLAAASAALAIVPSDRR